MKPATVRDGLIAAAALGLYAATAAGAMGAIPLPLRLLVALGGLVLLPGAALARLTAPAPGGAWLTAGWALGMGIAWNGVLLLACRALHADFRALVWLSPLLAAPLWIASAVRSHRVEKATPSAAGADVLRGRARYVVLALVALTVLHGLRMGTPIGYYTDSPDHVGTIRRMMGSGDMFPRDAFFADAGAHGADPRKGLWHPIVALVFLAAHADPFDGWVAMAPWMTPALLLNMAALGFLAGGGAAAALSALVLFLTLGGGLVEHYYREAVFATRLGDSLALAAGTALAADLVRPSARRRAATVLLGLGAVFAHVYYALQFLLVFGSMGLLLALRREDRGRLARWLATSALMGLACLPYLLYRAGQSYAPRNVIHTAPQGLLYLNDQLRVVSVGVMWDWLGLLWLALPFVLIGAARHSAGRPAWHYLVAAGTAPLVVMFTPPLVEALQPRVGYLLMRMVWMVPQGALVAVALVALAGRARAAGAGVGRWGAVAGMAALAALAVPATVDAVQVLLRPRRFLEEEHAHSALPWRDALEWMDRGLPGGTVVLADPVTSYSVPMLTRHYVVTLVDQHSSPNDPRALERILDSRDALDPYGTWARTLELLEEYQVGAIVLNERFARYVGLDYWAPYTGFLARARRRFDRHPEWFPVLYDTGDFVVYGVRRPLPDALPEEGPEPPWLVRELPAGLSWVADSSRSRARLVGLRFESPMGPEPTVTRGDTLHASAYWVAEQPNPAGSYTVHVRFDHAEFRVPAWLGWAAKPYRKLVEARDGRRYRFRYDHLPGEGQFNVDRWPPGRVVRDSFIVAVPADVAPGTYDMEMRLNAPPGHYPNYRLSDYFSDDDYYSGLRVARVRVVAGGGR
jgi:hypothetical protein